MAETAQPLKVPSTPAKPNAADIDNTPKPSRQASKRDVSKSGGSHEISSPHELTAFVRFTRVVFCTALTIGLE